MPDPRRPDRKQLVGLLPVNATTVLAEGAQIVPQAAPVHRPVRDLDSLRGTASIGHVTSAYHSPTLGRGFALALLAGGRSLIGSEALVAMPSGMVAVSVMDPVFIDKPGERLRPASTGTPTMQRPAMATGHALVAEPPNRVPLARPSELVQLSVLAGNTKLSVRAGALTGTAIGMALRVLLPTVPCRSVISRDRAALWLGPDEWLIIAPEGASNLAGQAIHAAGVQPVSVVDVSHRSRVLELTGPRAAWCLNAFCALDLDIIAFPVGMCTRTRFAKAEIVLWRVAPEIFHLDVARSFVPYVWACLEEARLEFTSVRGVSAG